MIGKQAAALGRASRWIEKSIDTLLLVDERQAGIVDALILPLPICWWGVACDFFDPVHFVFLFGAPCAIQVENDPWLVL